MSNRHPLTLIKREKVYFTAPLWSTSWPATKVPSTSIRISGRSASEFRGIIFAVKSAIIEIQMAHRLRDTGPSGWMRTAR
ncbi:MAG: hypothetical protein CL543_10260 [Alcanivorax sp.]|nr:hypothetical protein [Alcanivorax sp.]